MVKRYRIEGELIYQKDEGYIVRYEDYEALQQKFGGVSSLCEKAMRINCEWEKAMMSAIGEDGIGSVTKAIEQLKADKHALQQKLDALAAENDALMKFCKNAAFDADYESELGMERCGFTDAINDIKTPATGTYLNSVREEVIKSVPTVCDGKEEAAFEDYARSEGLDLSQHPIHYLFLDGKTYQARSAWRECLVYVANQLRSGNNDTADKAG